MSLVIMNNDDDDDDNSMSSSTNTDEDYDNLNHHNHRACSRYAPCNNKTHHHPTTNSANTSKSCSKKAKSFKGKIRYVDATLGRRQKYDGTRWRRMCSVLDCQLSLSSGVFYESWLCRNHYHKNISKDATLSRNIFTDDIPIPTSKNGKSHRSPTRLTTRSPERGDFKIDTDGIHKKYNGKIWRAICNYHACKSYAVARGYCHRHDVQIRNEKSVILSSLNDTLPTNSISTKSRKKQSAATSTEELPTNQSTMLSIEIPSENQPTVSSTSKPKKGDIQCIRQLWSGTKWYSLCQYYTQDCTRRSGGKKYASLCEAHYKEYVKQKKNSKLITKNNSSSISPTVKRKRSINNDNIRLSDTTDNSYPCQSTITHTKHTEQCIQTDVTCPLESKDFRQGCFLIDDDDNDEDGMDDQCQSESPQVMVYIKKEENSLSDKRPLAFDVNSLPINCKLEITKIEL